MRHRLVGLAIVALLWGAVAGEPVRGEPFYHVVDVEQFELDAEVRRDLRAASQQRFDHRQPRVSVDGVGAAYFSSLEDAAARPLTGGGPVGSRIAIRVPERRDVKGVLFVPGSPGEEHRVDFRISAEQLDQRADRDYYAAVAGHYRRLLRHADGPGQAWFRSQLYQAEQMLDVRASQPANRAARLQRRALELNRTFDLFSGTRAASENLALDDLLEPAADQLLADVDLAALQGVSIDPVDWDELIEDPEPARDAMAAYLPADQLAVFFPGVEALERALTEYSQLGTRIVQWSIGAEDDRTQRRYEQQLGVSVTVLAELAERVGMGSVTLTAGDPFLMAGTDLAMLIVSERPAELQQALEAAQEQAADSAGVTVRSMEIEGVDVTVARTDDRRVSSYLATVKDAVVLTNSPVQMQRIVATAAGDRGSLADQPEYIYFRGRYRLDEPQTLLMVISDEALRRWGSPPFRVAASRRARMLAGMLQARARYLEELLKGEVRPRQLETRLAVPESGSLRLTDMDVVSEVYGRPDFLTPINELAITHASQSEAEAYRIWLARYEGRWREVFCPIAVRMTFEPTRVASDATVLPLVVRSDYRQFLDTLGGAQVAADKPLYPHALAHLAVAIDLGSQPVQQLGQLARQGLAGLENPFGWMGETVGVYMDDSPYWQELAEAENPQAFAASTGYAFPVAVYADVADRLRLAGFLTSLRVLVQSTAPGMARWVNRQHEDREYLAVVATDVENLALYYAIHRGVLLVTLNEQTMHRFLESAEEDAAERPWLARHVNFHVSRQAAQLWQRISAAELRVVTAVQMPSWRYLPLLNDLRQHFPEHDPLEVYARLHGGLPMDLFGGEFVWSEEERTMRSTTAGHPGDPQVPETLPTWMHRFEFANFGLDYDAAYDALRARMLIDRRLP